MLRLEGALIMASIMPSAFRKLRIKIIEPVATVDKYIAGQTAP
jgi:hypothetical protein